MMELLEIDWQACQWISFVEHEFARKITHEDNFIEEFAGLKARKANL